MRCFIALWPGDAVRAALATGAGAMLGAACRAVPAANYHLTLCFLGAVPVERVSALRDCVAAIPVDPFDLTLDRAGCFPEAAVAWLAPASTPAPLAALRARTAAALRVAGIGFDERDWHPHVTIARRCRAAPAWRGPPIAWSVDDAVLCRSEGTDAGVRYAVIARTATASVR